MIDLAMKIRDGLRTKYCPYFLGNSLPRGHIWLMHPYVPEMPGHHALARRDANRPNIDAPPGALTSWPGLAARPEFLNTKKDEGCTKRHEVHFLSAGTFVILCASFLLLRVKDRGAHHGVWPCEMRKKAGSSSETEAGGHRKHSWPRREPSFDLAHHRDILRRECRDDGFSHGGGENPETFLTDQVQGHTGLLWHRSHIAEAVPQRDK